MKLISPSANEFTKDEKKAIGLLFLVLILGITYMVSPVKSEIVELSDQEYKRKMAEMTHSRLDDFYTSLPIRASSVSVYNSTLGDFIYQKKEDEIMPLASIVKIMSILVALENTQSGEVIKIERDALRQVGDHGLLVDELWERDELFRFTLITSSNDAMRAVAMHVGKKLGGEDENSQVEIFVDLMNQKSKELDLKSLLFLNDTGLDMNGKNGAYGNTKDVALLFDYALDKYPDIFSDTGKLSKEFTSLSGKTHIAQNTNQNIPKMQNLFASKTGFTNISGGNLVISLKSEKDDRIIISVLGSTFSERFTDIEKLTSTTLQIINEFQI